VNMYFLFSSGETQAIETFYSKEAAEISFFQARPKKGTLLEMCKGEVTETEKGVKLGRTCVLETQKGAW